MADTPPRLAVAQWLRLERIRAAAASAVVAQWRAAGEPLIAEAVATVLAGQRAIVAQTDAGLSLAAGIATGTAVTPIGVEADRIIGARARNGVSLETVYARSAKVARQDGFMRGVEHLRTSIYTDMQLAHRRAANAHAEADNRVTGWRRQINPGAGKVCGFCVAASTRLYRRGDLQPLHRMCRCSVVEIYVDSFTGNTIDRDRLNAVYDESGGATDRATLGRIRFTADDLPPGIDVEAVKALEPTIRWDHELGPVLDGTRHDTAFSLA